MSRFSHFAKFRNDFDLHVGPALTAWDRDAFAEEIRAAVEGILEISFPPKGITRSRSDGYHFWFADDRFEVNLYVDDTDIGFPYDRVPALLEVRSNLEEVETWELSESLYDRLDALGRYRLLAVAKDSSYIASNYPVGDTW
ncbi:hypothetical protein [Streptomyces tsukubensis]|uniref:hypothetical protein n=1 Tax=Streptomyces tsukubensis TaxID=83656 RepID=UPI00344CB139